MTVFLLVSILITVVALAFFEQRSVGERLLFTKHSETPYLRTWSNQFWKWPKRAMIEKIINSASNNFAIVISTLETARIGSAR